nr:RNase adapter RapZ [Motilibacter rhizosphaerae]
MTDEATAAEPAAAGGPRPVEMALVTGMSGAGRSTAAHALEDLGWYVVDNLPPSLLPRLADLGGRTSGEVERIAAVVDVRSLAFTADLRAAVEDLHAHGSRTRTLFLDATDDVLVRRFESNRRPHPLQGIGRILDGISAERRILEELRAAADVVLDTSTLNVHQLADAVARHFGAEDGRGLHVTVMSFGYKYGLPVDADLVADCRFLPNPHWVPELRPQTGRDAPVRDYVFAQPGAEEFVTGYAQLLQVIAPGYEREGKHYATVAIGCTGGKHRSVAMSERLTGLLRERGLDVSVAHRDLGRE